MKYNLGIQFSGINCGLKKKKKDLGLIFSEKPMLACAFFTTNKVTSGSVKIGQKNLSGNSRVRAVLVNSGNANCFTGTDYDDAAAVVKRAAQTWKLKEKEVLFCSTGVIGKRLPVEKIANSLQGLKDRLAETYDVFARAIMTTDTVKKIAVRKIFLGREEAVIIGIAKGAGMIYPDLATTLGFFLTNVSITRSLLRKAAQEALEGSFMSISVDGCRSTNDTVLFLSSGKTAVINKAAARFRAFADALKEACLDIAKRIVNDAEGIHHFITIRVTGARSIQDAGRVAFAIAHSPLFKCSVYGNNPSIGRVAAAAGSCGAALDEKKLKIRVEKPSKREVKLSVHIGLGKAEKTVYTSDLTPEYIKENVI